jgi:hypothetical protein
MTFSQLRILVAVVDHGGFTAAADAIMLSQPAVSHPVRACASLPARPGAQPARRSPPSPRRRPGGAAAA